MAEPDNEAPNEAVLRIIEWLHGEGYKATATANGRGVSSGTSGLIFTIFTYDRSIQFFMGMNLEPGDVEVQDCNDLNRDLRFLKIYLDPDQDLSVELDAIIDCSDEAAKDVFVRILRLWDSGLGQVKIWLRNLAEKSVAASAAAIDAGDHEDVPTQT